MRERYDWDIPNWSCLLARSKGESAYPELWPYYALCMALGPTGSSVADISNGRTATFVGAPSWVVSSGRNCLQFDGTDDCLLCPGSIPASPSGTIVVGLVRSGTSPIDEGIWSNRETSGNGWVQLSGSRETNRLFFGQNNGLVEISAYVDNVFPINEFAIVGGTWASGKGVGLWKNGIQIGYTGSATTNAITSTNTPRLATYFDFTDLRSMACQISFAISWDSELSASQMLAIAKDPYCWLRPKRAVFKAAAAAAGAGWSVFGGNPILGGMVAR